MTGQNPPLDEDSLANASLVEIHTALFLQLIHGHGQMALTFLGLLPNPQSGETEEPDLQAAKIFVDQLEMLESKTKGNLSSFEKTELERVLTITKAAWVDLLGNKSGH
ncbi:MAG TPA: DUF1844 domain-containing protein [Candidatus Limnocylindria bacterium]|jgi:hypothetical protein|nr:DUF1844 domain-containing protein [Candidatus Limnocylindria bacterium]